MYITKQKETHTYKEQASGYVSPLSSHPQPLSSRVNLEKIFYLPSSTFYAAFFRKVVRRRVGFQERALYGKTHKLISPKTNTK